MNSHLRQAQADDVIAIDELIAASARGLRHDLYTGPQVEAALGSAFGVDSQLIADGTYFVVEEGGRMLGCGGWSFRATLFGSDHERGRDAQALDPSRDAARIRAFFVHPEAARRGIGSTILSHCEQQAERMGFRRLELMSTLPGLAFYQTRGYRPGPATLHELPGGIQIRFVPMSKSLD
jgi:GNAT superfamily N-acetyltransferase